MTDWKWRIMLFARVTDNTAQNRAALASIFADNGSGENAESEGRIFDGAATRLSASGNPPAQAFGLETAVKADMRDALSAFLDGLTNARYVVVANTTLPQYADGELIATNFPITVRGQRPTFEDVLGYIENEFGLVQIVEEIA